MAPGAATPVAAAEPAPAAAKPAPAPNPATQPVAKPAPKPVPKPVAKAPTTEDAFRLLAKGICDKLMAEPIDPKKRRLAIYYFFIPPSNERCTVGEYVATMLPCFLEEMGKDHVVIFGRRHLDHAVTEQGKQLSALFNEREQIKVGQLIGARYIVGGDLFIRDKHYDVVAVVLDAETGKRIVSVRGKLPRAADLEKVAQGPKIKKVAKDAPADKDAEAGPAAKIIARGDHFYDQERDEDALAEYQAAFRLAPKSPKVLFRLGYLHQELKKAPGTAFVYYQQYLDLDPKGDANYHKALNNRGVILLERGKVADALKDFDAAIKANAKYAQAYANRGVARLRLPNPDFAAVKKDYEEAIRLEPDKVDHRYNMALLYVRMKDYPAAEKALSDVMRRSPKHLGALCERGRLYAEQLKKPQAAEKDFTEALKIDSKNVGVLYNRGIVRIYHLGNKPGGKADLEEALRLEPEGKYSKNIKSLLGAL